LRAVTCTTKGTASAPITINQVSFAMPAIGRKTAGTVWASRLRPATAPATLAFWDQDSPVGPGALLSKEKGLVYAGYFEDGKRSGAGVSFQPEDRSLFIGQWRNGVQQLKGTLVDQDGTLLYSGGFANGKRSGTGTEYDPNGQVRYTGKWAENAWNGEGVWYREDGHVIKGQFRSGAVDGQAVEYSKNGVKLYEGGFENGVYSGGAAVISPEAGGMRAAFWLGNQ